MLKFTLNSIKYKKGTKFRLPSTFKDWLAINTSNI